MMKMMREMMQSRLVGIITTLIPGNCPGDSCKVADGRGLFLYPSHNNQTSLDILQKKTSLLGMAEMFPEEEERNIETGISWDYSNEFRCSNLFVYFHYIDDDGAGSTSLEALQSLPPSPILSNFPYRQRKNTNSLHNE